MKKLKKVTIDVDRILDKYVPMSHISMVRLVMFTHLPGKKSKTVSLDIAMRLCAEIREQRRLMGDE